jgi:hypothetical protein
MMAPFFLIAGALGGLGVALRKHDLKLMTFQYAEDSAGFRTHANLVKD